MIYHPLINNHSIFDRHEFAGRAKKDFKNWTTEFQLMSKEAIKEVELSIGAYPHPVRIN